MQVLGGQLFHGGQRLAGGVLGRRLAADVGRGEQVVAHHPGGAGILVQGGDRAQGDHAAGGRADLQVQDIGAVLAEGRFGLGRDLVGAAEQVEVVDVDRAEIDVQGAVDVRGLHAEQLGLVLVDLRRQPGGGGVELGERPGELGRRAAGGDQFVGGVFQRVIVRAVPVLDHHPPAAAVAHAAHGGRGDDDAGGALDGLQAAHQVGAHGRGGQMPAVAPGEVPELHEQGAGVGLLR